MKATRAIMAGLLLLSAVSAASGQAIIDARERRPMPDPTPAPVPAGENAVFIKSHDVNVLIQDGAAVTQIDQVFHNPTGMILEGTYVFPLPSEAAVDRFSMYMDGREVQGEVMEAGKAREIYMNIVRRMQDPGLVELIGMKLIQARVYPIPARGDVRVKIQYSQALEQIADLFEYVYPVNSQRFSKRPLERVVLSVRIKSSFPIKSVYSPTHSLDISRKGDTEVVASYEGRNVLPGSDFQLFYNHSNKDFGLGVLCHATPREEGFFMMMISPKADFAEDEILPKDVVFVIDTSGSMKGEKMDQARKALMYCLKGLNPADRFGIVDFSTEARMYSDKLLKAEKAVLDDAVDYSRKLDARGGTNINMALREALKLKQADESRLFMIVFLTDGEPTIEVQNPDEILKNVSGWNKSKDRIFVFGVGFDVNTVFLDRLAEENRGSREYVKPEENIELKLSAFFDKVSYPVLSDLTIDFGGFKTEDVYPKKLPDLFKGTQILVFGRYPEAGRSALVLKGRSGGKTVAFEYTVEFPAAQKEHDFIAGLWARRKVGNLLDEIRLNGFHQELKDEIVRLGKKYGIVTPYTSFLVTEDSPEVLRRAERDRGHPGFAGSRPSGGGAPPSPNPSPTPTPTGTPTPTPTPAPGPSAGVKPMSAGEKGVADSEKAKEMKDAEVQDGKADDGLKVRRVEGKSFSLVDGFWVDQEIEGKKHEGKTVEVEYMSDAYFELVKEKPALAKLLAVGSKVKVLFEGVLYVVSPKEEKKN